MRERVRVAALSYINTSPFVYGLRHADCGLCADLSLHTPSQCVSMLNSGECDISLISVAALESLKDVNIVTNFCISATGSVRTVELLSNTEVNSIENIYLDCDSHTSVELIKILTREYWNISPNFINIDYSGATLEPQSGDAYVMIGDKVFDWESKFKYSYDLAEHWFNHTGLPFVFAVWVARKDVDKEVIDKLNIALDYGVMNIKNVCKELEDKIDFDTAYSYLTKNIEFRMTDNKRDAMRLFRKKSFLLKSEEFSSHCL